MARDSHLSIRVSAEEKAPLQQLADRQEVSLGQLASPAQRASRPLDCAKIGPLRPRRSGAGLPATGGLGSAQFLARKLLRPRDEQASPVAAIVTANGHQPPASEAKELAWLQANLARLQRELPGH